MRTWWGVLVVVAVAVVAIAGSGVAEAAPGGAKGPPAPDPAETIEVINGILAVAQAEMENIAEEFVANAPSAESPSDFDAMQDTAEFHIGLAKGVADTLLRGIRDQAESGPVYDAAVSALQELGASRDAALAVVESVEYVDPATATTATSSTTTTTVTSSTASTTTTTTPAPTSTTTTTTAAPPTGTTSAPQPPSSGSTTTSVPDLASTTALPGTSTTPTTVAGVPNTTTVPPTSTTTTTVPGVSTTTTIPATIVAPEGRSGGGGAQFAVAMPSEDGLLGAAVPDPEPPSPVVDLTGRVASTLDIVLPPMVVTAVLSPLIIFEVIGRTILRSGSAILVPMLLLGLSVLFLRWRDRGRGTERISRVEESGTAPAA